MSTHRTTSAPAVSMIPIDLLFTPSNQLIIMDGLQSLQEWIAEDGLIDPLHVCLLGDVGWLIRAGCRRFICICSLTYQDDTVWDRMTSSWRRAPEVYALVACRCYPD